MLYCQMDGLGAGAELKNLELEFSRNRRVYWTRNWPGMVATGIGIGLESDQVDSDIALHINL